jgi:hypothetical protein
MAERYLLELTETHGAKEGAGDIFGAALDGLAHAAAGVGLGRAQQQQLNQTPPQVTESAQIEPRSRPVAWSSTGPLSSGAMWCSKPIA